MVTCSEQMTTHMNGKRHLNKEKHHILSMMKSAQSKGKQIKMLLILIWRY